MRRAVIILIVILAAWNIILTVNMMSLVQNEERTSDPVIKELNTEFETDYTDLVSLVSDKVVSVVVHGNYSDSYGSGVIYGKQDDGSVLIVTSAHLFGGSEADVIFTNRAVCEAEVLGSDSLSDIALLLVKPDFNVEPFNIGNSALVKEGEWILTVGSKITVDYSQYYYQGIVSSTNRTVRKHSDDSGLPDYDMNMIQTSAVIDNACVGGALVNMNGDLIGILNSSPASAESYALNINEVKLVCDEILSKGSVGRTLLGFFARDLNDLPLYMKSYYGTDLSIEKGIIVTEVAEGSKADLAGIKVGDVITEISGLAVESYQDYRRWIYENDAMSVTLELHSGEDVGRINIDTLLEALPEEEND